MKCPRLAKWLYAYQEVADGVVYYAACETIDDTADPDENDRVVGVYQLTKVVRVSTDVRVIEKPVRRQRARK